MDRLQSLGISSSSYSIGDWGVGPCIKTSAYSLLVLATIASFIIYLFDIGSLEFRKPFKYIGLIFSGVIVFDTMKKYNNDKCFSKLFK